MNNISAKSIFPPQFAEYLQADQDSLEYLARKKLYLLIFWSDRKLFCEYVLID